MQLTTEYFYDELNQLIRENDPYSNKTITYLYDAGGNIREKREYNYTKSDTLGTPTKTTKFNYVSSVWTDLLTSYTGHEILYDAVGNPLKFGDITMTWERGRKLSTMTFADDSTASYKYNADGVRTQKTVGGVTTDYFLEGSTIVAQKTGNDVWYYFGSDGTRDAIEYNGTVYYYMYNPQGDVIGLFDGNTNVVVEYTYDSWGKIISTTGSLKDTLGKANPFRYRGYYYDEESGLYYLNSRYYHPEIGRFINADDFDIIDVQGDLYDKNLFAYCDNNPTCRIDVGGYAWETIWDAISLASGIVEVAANPYDPWAWVGLAGDAADILIPFIGGIGETTRALKAASKTTKVIDTTSDIKKGWKVGEDITNLTKAGNVPSWSTLRSRYWKNKAHYFSSEYSNENISRMMRGLAPRFDNGAGMYSMELHHMLGRKGNNYYLFFEISPYGHAIVDPFRHIK